MNLLNGVNNLSEEPSTNIDSNGKQTKEIVNNQLSKAVDIQNSYSSNFTPSFKNSHLQSAAGGYETQSMLLSEHSSPGK